MMCVCFFFFFLSTEVVNCDLLELLMVCEMGEKVNKSNILSLYLLAS